MAYVEVAELGPLVRLTYRTPLVRYPLVTETANPEITSAEEVVVKVQLEEDVLNADTELTEDDDTVASFVVPTVGPVAPMFEIADDRLL
jgi:hypothetical protein